MRLGCVLLRQRHLLSVAYAIYGMRAIEIDREMEK